jgi:tripartite-type tricarboxylate transporter receptor subunit TctC
VGGGAHLAGELLRSRSGANVLHVPYKGGPPILAAVAGGEVQFGYAAPTGAVAMIKSGRVNGLAVTSAKRAKALPDVPTIAESGFPGYDVTPWYGFLVPAATPRAVIDLLNAEVGRILKLPEIESRFESLGFEATASTPERFGEILRSEIQLAAKIIKDAGIKAE